MKNIMCAAIASVVLVSCMKNEQRETAPSTVEKQPVWVQRAGADGTADENAAQLIRRSLVANNSLPTNGKDVILIIADRTITLRGTVKSEQEKISVGAMARQYAGAKDIDNQLEIVN
ncbi:MAG: BON domain-containing protein [Candidatus Binatia bacterium]